MRNIFRGVTTAMITPFLSDGSVDFEGLRIIHQHQLDNGINGLLPLGTTGETPTLTEDEKEKIVRTVVESVQSGDRKVPVMVVSGPIRHEKTSRMPS